MRPVVLAQCACCSRLPPPLWCLLHLARLRCAGGIPVGRPWGTGKASRCGGFRRTDAPWGLTMQRETATTTQSAGTTSSNAALIGERLAINKGTGLHLKDSCLSCGAAVYGWGYCHGWRRCWSIHMELRPGHQASHQEQAGGSCDHQTPLQRDQRAEEYLLDLLGELGLSMPNSIELVG